MNKIKKTRSEYIKTALESSLIPRNQVATISGLTNKYIRDLEECNINNVSREKLIAFAVAANLDLPQMDKMMAIFDRADLSLDDIPSFLNMAKKINISNIHHPLREEIIYELAILAAENLSGPKVLNSSRLTRVLCPEGHRAFSEKPYNTHKIYAELSEAIGRERKRVLNVQLSQHLMEHFIFKGDLKNYIINCSDETEKKFRIQHLEQIKWHINNFPNFKYYITDIYHAFTFICITNNVSEMPVGHVIFTGREFEYSLGRLAGRLAAFCTSNRVTVENFKDDSKSLRAGVIEKYSDTNKLTDYLDGLIVEARKK